MKIQEKVQTQIYIYFILEYDNSIFQFLKKKWKYKKKFKHKYIYFILEYDNSIFQFLKKKQKYKFKHKYMYIYTRIFI